MISLLDTQLRGGEKQKRVKIEVKTICISERMDYHYRLFVPKSRSNSIVDI